MSGIPVAEVPKGVIPEDLAHLDLYNAAGEKVHEAGEQIIEATQRNPLGFVLGGLFVGLAAGGAAGYFITRRRLETKYNKITEDTIAEMRQHYRDKTVALENTAAKPELETLVREQGYSDRPPMAVTPPEAVVERAETVADEERAEPRPPVPVVREENVFSHPVPTDAELGNWDMDKERSRRSGNRPYVVHIDEVREEEEYDTVTYTYYEEDDVLCNERDEVIDKQERDILIGEANLNRFGHGSEDPTKVYIRNDKLEMQMEVIRSPNSYAEEVHGFQHWESPIRPPYRRERRSQNDE